MRLFAPHFTILMFGLASLHRGIVTAFQRRPYQNVCKISIRGWHSSLLVHSSAEVEEISIENDEMTQTEMIAAAILARHRPYFRIYYNDVYRVDLPPRHRFPMKKYEQVRLLVQERILRARSQKENEVNNGEVYCDFLVSPLATFEELATTHSKDYIQRFLRGGQTPQEQRNVGFPWSEQGVNRALSSVGGTMAAACHVCDVWKQRLKQIDNDDAGKELYDFSNTEKDKHNTNEEIQMKSAQRQPKKEQRSAVLAPWGAHIAGGTHHAFYDYGEGFSVFSDIAVAANVVLDRYPDLIQNILIIDLDVHQGNGNAVLFQGRPEVVTFSIQCEGNYFSQKQTSDLDIELPISCNDATYLVTLNHWLKQIEKERGDTFDLIFFQAGVDVLEDDRLGRMDLSQKGVERRNQLVYEFADRLNVPLVICMGGGYPRGEDWTPILDAHANVYSQAYTFLADRAKNH